MRHSGLSIQHCQSCGTGCNRCRSSRWPGNFHLPWVQPKQTNKQTPNTKQTTRYSCQHAHAAESTISLSVPRLNKVRLRSILSYLVPSVTIDLWWLFPPQTFYVFPFNLIHLSPPLPWGLPLWSPCVQSPPFQPILTTDARLIFQKRYFPAGKKGARIDSFDSL